MVRTNSRSAETLGPYAPMRAASTGKPSCSAWSMLMPASSSSERLKPAAGVIRLRSTEYTGRGGRRRFHGRLDISKYCCQSRLPHMVAPLPGVRSFSPTQMHSLPIRSLWLPRNGPGNTVARCGNYFYVRHLIRVHTIFRAYFKHVTAPREFHVMRPRMHPRLPSAAFVVAGLRSLAFDLTRHSATPDPHHCRVIQRGSSAAADYRRRIPVLSFPFRAPANGPCLL